MPKGVQKLANDRQIPFLFNTAEEANFDAPVSKAYCGLVCKRTLPASTSQEEEFYRVLLHDENSHVVVRKARFSS